LCNNKKNCLIRRGSIYLVVFYYLSTSDIWLDKRCDLLVGVPLYQGNYCITLKNSQVSVMGVKHHYQQHYLRNITASQFKRWRKREYSNQLQTDTLYHMMYTVHFYTIGNRTLARQHTFGYAGFIWYCQAPVIVCCVVN